MTPGPVLLRRNVRLHKNEPLVDEVELLDVNPMYANIKLQDGRESTVSIRDLAPCPTVKVVSPTVEDQESVPHEVVPIVTEGETSMNIVEPSQGVGTQNNKEIGMEVRRSRRATKAPNRYGWN